LDWRRFIASLKQSAAKNKGQLRQFHTPHDGGIQSLACRHFFLGFVNLLLDNVGHGRNRLDHF
jgi:hypothetical protein